MKVPESPLWRQSVWKSLQLSPRSALIPDLGAVWAGRKDYCLSSTRSGPGTMCCLFHGVIWSAMGV